MRLALVTITLMGSLGAAIALLPNKPPEDRLATVTDIGKGGLARLEPPASAPATSVDETLYRTFSLPLVFAGANAKRGVETRHREAARIPARPTSRIETSTDAATAAEATAPPKPVIAERPQSLMVAVQAELRRLGCYSGALDGDWGPASRLGLRAFMNDAGTTLPVRRPDYVMLTLLRGYTGQVCGTDCTSGRRSPSTGVCLNGPTLATRTIKRTVEQGRQPDQSGERTGSNLDARPHAATTTGITVQPVQSSPGTTSSAWITTTTVDTAPVLVQGPSRVTDPRNSPPPEGRMAVGGPVSVVTPVNPPPAAQTVQVQPAADQHSDAQLPSRASNRSSRSWTASRRNTSWTATFFDR